MKPQGSAASCGIEKGKILNSPISKFSDILKYFLFSCDILLDILSNAFQVFLFAYIGILYLLDKVAKLFVWSMCSCVTRIAEISFPDILNSPKGRYYFFRTNSCIY